jgi:hypothetical protein
MTCSLFLAVVTLLRSSRAGAVKVRWRRRRRLRESFLCIEVEGACAVIPSRSIVGRSQEALARAWLRGVPHTANLTPSTWLQTQRSGAPGFVTCLRKK